MTEQVTTKIRFSAESLVIKCTENTFEEINGNLSKNSSIIEFKDPEYSKKNGEMTIFNSDDILIDEALYISKQRHFGVAATRIQKKVSADNLLQFTPSTNDFEVVPKRDEKFVNAVLDQIRKNNINSDSDNIVFEIPADFFDLILPITTESQKILNYMKELFSLILLSDSVNLEENTFIFRVENSENESSEKKITWKEWDSLDGSNYYEAYSWLKLKHTENYGMSTLIKVIRQVLGKSENLQLENNITSKFESMLNIIISEQSEVYFDQQNKLKEEFLNLNKAEIDSNNKLFSKLLGLIVSVGAAIYGVLIKNLNADNKIEILKPNNIIGISFCIALLAILFFFFTYFVDIHQRRKLYIKLKKFYVNQLQYSKADFENSVEEPHFISGNSLQLSTLLLFFIVATGGVLFYFGYLSILTSIISHSFWFFEVLFFQFFFT